MFRRCKNLEFKLGNHQQEKSNLLSVLISVKWLKMWENNLSTHVRKFWGPVVEHQQHSCANEEMQDNQSGKHCLHSTSLYWKTSQEVQVLDVDLSLN